MSTTTLDDHPHPYMDIRWDASDFAAHLTAEGIECHATPRYRIRPGEALGVAVLAAAAKRVLQLAEPGGEIDA